MRIPVVAFFVVGAPFIWLLALDNFGQAVFTQRDNTLYFNYCNIYFFRFLLAVLITIALLVLPFLSRILLSLGFPFLFSRFLHSEHLHHDHDHFATYDNPKH